MLKEYGDNSEFHWQWLSDIVSPHWVDNKEALTVAVHRIIAHFFSISIEKSYSIVSELCGAIFIFLWLWFVQKLTLSQNGDSLRIRILQLILFLLGICSGATLVFYGHVENYAFGILAFTTFLLGLYFYVDEAIGTVPFVFLFLFAFKAHIIGILYLPCFLVALAFRYRSKFSIFQNLFTWRRIRNVVIAPAFGIGVILYVFLFHSWNEPYGLTDTRQLERSFLPIVPQRPPLDHYSLLSLYHLADLANLFLLISAPIVITLAGIFLFNRKSIEWNGPRVILFGLGALFPFLFFLAMNPILSPVRDWDVYSLFLPSILFFTAILLVENGIRGYEPSWLAQTLVFGTIFTTVLVAVNVSSDELRIRLQDAGAYVYRSYYAGSDYIEARSLALTDTSQMWYPHFASIVASLAKSSMGSDEELATMESRLANFYQILQNSDSAILWAAAAYRSDSRVHRYLVDLAAYETQADKLEAATATIDEYLKNRSERSDTEHSNDNELAEIMAQLAARYSRTGNDSLTLFWANSARVIAPQNLKYTYDLATYCMQTNRPNAALDLYHSVPNDSLTVPTLRDMAIAAASAYGPDSAVKYLVRLKALSPNDRSIDSLILEMKSP